MMQYGFQRLVLLGSAGYQRAELPLDDSVSLIAPNNTGKTSLINALQFLLIINTRRMDFGSHDWTKTRRFYFPDNSAYILLEVLLPQTGTVVLGCVGKGVSHDYEYFAYQGDLKVDDFKLADGTLVQQPQLIEALAERGRSVYRYDSREFARLLYGGSLKSRSNEPDFTVFRLENVSDRKVFQEVLTRTLRLDNLTSAKVKDYLQKIFHRDLPDADIDFKQEWDKAFHEVNAERAQYLAAERQLPRIRQLEVGRDQRLTVRGQLIDWRERIDSGLAGWQAHYDSSYASLGGQCDALKKQQADFLPQYEQLIKAQQDTQQQLADLTQQARELEQLQTRFALLEEGGRPLLERELATTREALDELTSLLRQTEGRKPAAIERDIKTLQRELASLAQQLANHDDNLFQRLSEQLPPSDVERLNRVLSRDVLLLDSAHANFDVQRLQDALAATDSGRVRLAGLEVSLDTLGCQYQELTIAAIDELQQDGRRQLASLEKQLTTAHSREETLKQRDRQLHEIKRLERDLIDFERLQELLSQSQTRAAQQQSLKEQAADLQQQIDNASQHNERLQQQLNEVRADIGELDERHRRIDRLRNQRLDHGDAFAWLTDLQYDIWLGETDWPLGELADRLQTYQELCRELIALNGDMRAGLTELHAGGLTKYQYSDGEDAELARIIEFCQQLPKEREALEKKARSAVVNVTASLRELRDGLYALQNCMRDFNRQIGRRQLSDLSTFKIEAVDETALVEAIDLLIDKAAQVESGDNFSLFNQQSVLDDATLARAKQRLIDEGEARNGLKVGDLFRLEFVIGKKDQPLEAFEEIDSAASNGTVLMAKLVTGLAMLYQMQDKRTPFRAICYLDEALALDSANQKSLIATAAEFGYALIFASPAPLTTARYCVPIHRQGGKNHIHRNSWQIFEPLEPPLSNASQTTQTLSDTAVKAHETPS